MWRAALGAPAISAAAGDGTTTSPAVEPWLLPERRAGSARETPVLAIAWSAAEPHRVGEVALLDEDGAAQILGRGAARLDDGHPRVAFVRQRPWSSEACAPLEAPGISRRHLLLTARAIDRSIAFEQLGRAAVLHNGHEAKSGLAQPGDTLAIENQMVLFCTRRALPLASPRHLRAADAARFGVADADGIVGESAPIWALREEIAFAGASPAHVLILGESGTGKELVAHAVHRASPRAAKKLLARSAVSFPETLVDAELFGHARDYPNAGMPLREGLLGAASGTSLFLDEIGELPHSLQAHLLRVLDAGGQYHRLGETAARHSDFRLIAATNRPVGALKHDFAARLALRIRVPSLAERREDIPLLCHHLLDGIAARSPELCARFAGTGANGARFYRFAPSLIDELLRHPYALHVRELGEILWQSLRDSRGALLQRSASDVRAAMASPAPVTTAPRRAEPTADEIRAALAAQRGNRSKAYLDLGLSSRYALRRLLKKHGIKDDGSDS